MARVVNHAAIVKEAVLGKDIQGSFSCVADDYREGKSFREINEKYDIAKKYNVSDIVATRAVGNAIRGWYGGFGVKDYGGLIDGDELDNIKETYRKSISHRKSSNHGLQKKLKKTGAKKVSLQWGGGEVDRLRNLASLKGITPKFIAALCNDEYHGGDNVRTEGDIVEKLKEIGVH